MRGLPRFPSHDPGQVVLQLADRVRRDEGIGMDERHVQVAFYPRKHDLEAYEPNAVGRARVERLQACRAARGKRPAPRVGYRETKREAIGWISSRQFYLLIDLVSGVFRQLGQPAATLPG